MCVLHRLPIGLSSGIHGVTEVFQLAPEVLRPVFKSLGRAVAQFSTLALDVVGAFLHLGL
jgi:hypothetical protein